MNQALGRRSATITRNSQSKRIATTCRMSPVAHAPSRARASFAGAQLRKSNVSLSPSIRQTRSRTPVVAVQANLFSRLTRVIKAYVDSLVGTFEDPDKLLDRVVDEMTMDSQKMRQASGQATAAYRQMQKRADDMQAGADEWLRRAELAVARNLDDLAREALARRKTMQTDADRLKQQAQLQKNAVDQLQGSVKMLESKITEARGKKETLKARAASAKSNIAVQELIGGLRSTSSTSFAAFDKMEEKVMALEAEAQSVAAMSTPDGLEARFAMLEGGGVEDELAALKAGQSQQNQQFLPRPRMSDVLERAPKAEIDMELEELRRKARAF